MRPLLAILLLLLSASDMFGQEDTVKHKLDTLPEKFYVLPNVYRDGESLPEIEIKEVTIVGHARRSARFQFWRYEKLVYNVRRVYPYSVIVRAKFGEVNAELAKLSTDKERREYLKQVEKNMFRDYEDDLKHMNITQGKLLIKLVSRETKNTSFELIKDYRGKISAAFWQGIARIFGTNLKVEYDPYGEDALIEKIILEIEAGRL